MDICGRLKVFFSTMRMFFICFMMFVRGIRADIVVTDQVSSTNIAVRLLRLAKSKLVFYCHYPDALLCTERGNMWKRLYRAPFDWIEARTTDMCDILLVNSKFTAGVVGKTFPHIQTKLHVLYPPIDMKSFNDAPPEQHPTPYLLSLNRYERKKDVALVIESFAAYALKMKGASKSVSLVIAGGYDPRVKENVEYHDELVRLAESLKVSKRVTFLKNVSDSERKGLLANAAAVIYSPQGEHFGIVPCEAMALGTPVVAWNNGGPTESVVHDQTGYLCNDRADFATNIHKILSMSNKQTQAMSEKCKSRVTHHFSLVAFSLKLEKLMLESPGKRTPSDKRP
jgi:alpha-1,3/alpha-1,6-mannosyltransferase